jgi:hypothetical protein
MPNSEFNKIEGLIIAILLLILILIIGHYVIELFEANNIDYRYRDYHCRDGPLCKSLP